MGLAFANPYVTVINELAPGTGTNSWVELHLQPEGLGFDSWPMSGRVIRTTSSVCTLHCCISSGQYIVIDSAALAQGGIASGTFRLNPDSDFVSTWCGLNPESICYPRSPTSGDAAPAPPRGGSIAYWTLCDEDEFQDFNWYVDSTPTPGAVNDDWSAVTGTLSVDGQIWYWPWVEVFAHGPYGDCQTLEYNTSDYVVCGLGAGRYSLEAWAGYDTVRYRGVYPESVTVGFGRIASGINIPLARYAGIAADSPAAVRTPKLYSAGRLLSLELAAPVIAQLDLLDLAGRRREILYRGRLSAGLHRFQVSDRVDAGVYFVRLTIGNSQSTAKVVFAH